MERIEHPIILNESGTKVAVLQHALLFIVAKRQFTIDGIAPPDWKRKLEANQELGGQRFGDVTLQLLLGVLRELHLPTADSVNDVVAEALNQQLEELGAFPPEPTNRNYVVRVRALGKGQSQLMTTFHFNIGGGRLNVERSLLVRVEAIIG